MAFTTLSGTSLADATTLVGTSGIDLATVANQAGGLFLTAEAADDQITITEAGSKYEVRAGSGDDKIASAGLTKGTINGNAGLDTLNLTSLVDSSIYGGRDNDGISATSLTSSTINGNIGDDILIITESLDKSIVYGGKGNDTFTVNGTLSTSGVNGDIGADIINLNGVAFTNSSSVQGGANADTITLSGIGQFSANSSVLGGQGADTLNATNVGVDTAVYLYGEADNDTLTGGGGGDFLRGGNGNDSVTGNAGTDDIVGNAGNDTFNGGAGIDTFRVDSGSDTINDIAVGGVDIVVVSAAATLTNAVVTADWAATAATVNNGASATFTSEATGDDIDMRNAGGTVGFIVNGFAGAAAAGEILFGNANNDTLNGLSGDDSLTSGNGVNSLTGGAGLDSLAGGGGDDTLNGGAGMDTISAALGDDDIDYVDMAGLAAGTGAVLADSDDIIAFVSGTDQIATGIAGTGLNYVEAVAAANFAAAAAAADIAFNSTIRYYMTSTAADGGLLFFDSDLDGTLNGLIRLDGLASTSFAETDIIA